MSQSPLLQWRGATETVPSTALVASSTTLRGAQKTSLLTAILNATSRFIVKTNNDATNFALQQYKQNAARISVQQQQEWQEQFQKDTKTIEEANEYVQDMVALASDIMIEYKGEITQSQMMTKLNAFARETKRKYAHVKQKTESLNSMHVVATSLVAMVMVYVDQDKFYVLEEMTDTVTTQITEHWVYSMLSKLAIGGAISTGLTKLGNSQAASWVTNAISWQAATSSVDATKDQNIVTSITRTCEIVVNWVNQNMHTGTMVISNLIIVLSVFVRVVLMFYYWYITPTRKSSMDQLRKELLNLRSAAKQVPRLENDLFPHVEAVVRAACM